jgi:hypothetical protein
VQNAGHQRQDHAEQLDDACHHVGEGTPLASYDCEDRTTFIPDGKDRPQMTNTKDRVADAASNARPYVERALRDQELRDNIRNAYTSARAVYEELSSRKRVSDAASQIAADKDIQDQIRSAIDELRNATRRVKDVKRAAPEPERAAKQSLILLFGIVLGLLLNPITGPALRRALGRKLFGSDNGFVYQGNGTKAS